MKFKTLIFTFIFGFIFGNESFSQVSSPVERIGIYSEFLPVNQLVDYFSTHADPISEGPILINVNAENANSGQFWDQVQALSKIHSKLRFWVTGKPNTDDYWLNTQSVQTYLQIASEVEMRAGKIFDRVELTFDLEPSATTQKTMASDLKSLKWMKAHRYLKYSDQLQQWSAAIRLVQEWVDNAHKRNVFVHAVTGPFVIDTDQKKMLLNEQRLGIPFDPTKIKWDEVSFMVYRAEFRNYFPQVSSAIVFDYAVRIKSWFGDRGGIDLGEYGTVEYPTQFTGLTKEADLLNDLAEARRAGISKIQLYSFDGILASSELEASLQKLNLPTSYKDNVDESISAGFEYWFLNSCVKKMVF